jgi:hypothetical protein
MARQKKLIEGKEDELPGVAKEQYVAARKRSRPFVASQRKMVNKVLREMGTSRKELKAQADRDFAQAGAESKTRLARLVKQHLAIRRKQGPLADRLRAVTQRTKGGAS